MNLRERCTSCSVRATETTLRHSACIKHPSVLGTCTVAQRVLVDEHLEGVVLGGVREHVVRFEDLVEREFVGHELFGR